MKDKRPVNLDLTTIKFPAPAIASILHRISGIVVFLLIPFLLVLLKNSLVSADSFQMLKTEGSLLFKLTIWVFLAGLIYHLVAGIRHLFMDAHLGEELRSGRVTAIAAIVISVILILAVGILL